MAIWITLVMAGLVLVFARSMRVEAAAAANHVAAMQAEEIARGALQYAIAHLDNARGVPPSPTDVPCEAVQVGDGFFWILRPNFDSAGAYTFGFVDEAAKINLNSTTTDALLKLPNMTTEAAASIKTWRDPPGVSTPEGAETSYYLSLPDPYNAKNSPFETVEELLLVKGVDSALLYGQDRNRNGFLDAGDAELAAPPPGTDNPLDMGIFNHVTVYSAEAGSGAGGPSLVNVNDTNMTPLSRLLRRTLSAARVAAILNTARDERPFRNVLDFYFRARMTMEEFKPVCASLTTRTQRAVNGLANVNTAPKAVLLCLPGLDASDAASLAAKRAEANTDLTSIAWVADALPREKAIGIGGDITVRSFQFSADIVAVSGNGRAFKRYRAVLDARQSPPTVRYWKDLTHLGWPLSPDIRSALRAGTFANDTITLTAAGSNR